MIKKSMSMVSWARDLENQINTSVSKLKSELTSQIMTNTNLRSEIWKLKTLLAGTVNGDQAAYEQAAEYVLEHHLEATPYDDDQDLASVEEYENEKAVCVPVE